jgi:hypothetical protein
MLTSLRNDLRLILLILIILLLLSLIQPLFLIGTIPLALLYHKPGIPFLLLLFPLWILGSPFFFYAVIAIVSLLSTYLLYGLATRK